MGASKRAKPGISDPDELIKKLKQKIAQEPEEILAYYELAHLYALAGKHAQMEKILQALIDRTPDLSIAHFLMAQACGRQKKKKKMEQAAAKALQLVQDSLVSTPDAPRPRPTKSAGISKWNDELQSFKECYPNDPNLAEAKYYEKVIESGQYSYEQTFLLGLAYKRLGWHSAAIVAFQQVIKMKPDYDEPYFELGNTYKHMGKYADAVLAYREAIRFNAEAPEAHFQLGLALAKTKNTEDAMQAYQTLKKLDNYLAEQLLDEIKQNAK
jgi:tetratricopeptide (TPR) repeat protein